MASVDVEVVVASVDVEVVVASVDVEVVVASVDVEVDWLVVTVLLLKKTRILLISQDKAFYDKS